MLNDMSGGSPSGVRGRDRIVAPARSAQGEDERGVVLGQVEHAQLARRAAAVRGARLDRIDAQRESADPGRVATVPRELVDLPVVALVEHAAVRSPARHATETAPQYSLPASSGLCS